MAMNSVIQVRVEEELRKEADALFAGLGFDTTTAIRIFLAQAVRERGIPFPISEKVDPFYSDSTMRMVKKAIAEAETGKLTPHDLIED